jgi:uncharacterized membrane protein YbhN (UPF0104 family)
MRLRLVPREGGPAAQFRRIARRLRTPASLTVAKLLVSVGLLIWLIDRVRLTEQPLSLGDGDWRALVVVWLLQSLLPLVQAARWRLIAAALGRRLPFAAAVTNVYIGQFFNQVLPSSVGGDAVRVWKLTRLMPLQVALTSVAFDRIVALISVPLIMMVGSGMLFHLVPPGALRWTLLAMTAAMACGLVLLLCGDRIPLPARLAGCRPVEFARSVPRAARRLFCDPGRLACGLVLSVLIHFGVGTSLWVLALGNSVDAPLATFLVLAPLITMVTTVPISIGGWGVREGAIVAALGLLGVAPASALAVSVQFGLVMLVVGLPGGVLTLLDSLKRRAAEKQRSTSTASLVGAG